MKIIVVNKSTIEQIPPVLSAINILCDLKYNVVSISTGITKSNAELLKRRGVDVNVVNDYKGTNKFKKLISYHLYKKQVFRLIEKYAKKEPVLLWIEGAYTILALGTAIKKYKYILQISELHESYKYQLNAIKRVIGEAQAVFMPEYNRTVLYKLWFKLKKRPTVLPNKPYAFPTEEDFVKVKEEYKDVINKLANKKIILYQGHICADRDLSGIAKAVESLNNDYILLLMGLDHGGFVEKYKSITSKILYIGNVPAPYHLIFTSMARVGILSYNDDVLNNLYCAPNKIFEYSYYGLPMIGNDIPGLRYSVEAYGAGLLVDFDNVENIKNAINTIDALYQNYVDGSNKLFDSVDNKMVISNVLKEINIGND